MTLRPPQASSSSRTARIDALDYEIAQEQVAALGRMGRALEAALAALAEHDRSHGAKDAARARLVHDASDALWCFMVQREAFGLRDPPAGHPRLSRSRRGAQPDGCLRPAITYRLPLAGAPAVRE
jgi:hypothetical protein